MSKQNLKQKTTLRRALSKNTLLAVLFLVGVVILIALLMTRPKAAEYKLPNLSCTNFDRNMFKPPLETKLYNEAGIKLNSRTLPADKMQPIEDESLADGSQAKLGVLSTVKREGDKLSGVPFTLPQPYNIALSGLLNDDAIRFGACKVKGGMEVSIINDESEINGYYNQSTDGIELYFFGGGQSKYLSTEREVKYLLTHEFLHKLRADVLNTGTDGKSIALIRKIDELYRKQLIVAAESIRSASVEELQASVEEVREFVATKTGSEVDGKTRAAVNEGADFLSDRIAKKNGLTDLIVSFSDANAKPMETRVGWNAFEDMLAMSSAKANVETANSTDKPYDLYEIFSKSDNKEGIGLLEDISGKFNAVLEEHFLSEKVMPGNESGQAWTDSDETFATAGTLTKVYSRKDYPKVVEGLPKQQHETALQILETMHEFRNTVTIASAGGQ